MSKTHKTTSATSPKPIEAPHLDDAITRSVTKGLTFFQKFRMQLAFGLALVIICFFIYTIWGWVRDARQDDLLARLHLLVGTESAREADVATLLGELDRLAEDSRGEESERLVLKSLVQFLLGKAYPDAPPFSSTPQEPTAGAGESKNIELVKRIDDLARTGAQRYPDDPDIKAWSEAVLARTKGEREFKLPEAATPVVEPASPATSASNSPLAVPPALPSGVHPTVPSAPAAPASAPQPNSAPPTSAGK